MRGVTWPLVRVHILSPIRESVLVRVESSFRTRKLRGMASAKQLYKTAQLGDAFFINIRFHVRENWFYEMVNGYTRVFNVPAPKNTTEGASTSLESPRREGVGMEIMCGARTKVYLADLTDK